MAKFQKVGWQVYRLIILLRRMQVSNKKNVFSKSLLVKWNVLISNCVKNQKLVHMDLLASTLNIKGKTTALCSDVVKSVLKPSKSTDNVRLYIKSKNAKGDSDKKISEFKTAVNLADLALNINFTKALKTGVLITCGGKDSLNKRKSTLSEKIGHSFVIGESIKLNPQLKILGVARDAAGRT